MTDRVEPTDTELLGRQLAFPLRVDARGRFAWSSGEDGIVDSIEMILSTRPGERLRRPDYGAGLDLFVFETNNRFSQARIAAAVKESLARDEPRITVVDIEVTTDPDDAQIVLVTVVYSVVATTATAAHTVAVPVRG